MSYSVDLLSKDEFPKLELFLQSLEISLLYQSTYYRNFLEKFLQEDAYYFIIKEGNEIIALLPSMLKKNHLYGNVLNSLPFYGSNGGVVTNSNDIKLYTTLIDTFYKFAIENNCISATIITSPLEVNQNFYEQITSYDYKDQRIGQLTFLPDDINKLMDLYHTKTRNTIRKSLKFIKSISWKNGLHYLDFISETHKENLMVIGGAYKPARFFQDVVNCFEYGSQLRIYIAFDEADRPISGLINLYYNRTIEYFTPVTVAKYRELQPLSGIIYQAMMDGVVNGFKVWNWGGTWLTQDGVYQFKSKWGTRNCNYYYYTRVFDKNILSLSKDILLSEYPYFFVVPFHALSN